MASVLLAATPNHGHVSAVLQVGRGLRSHGHHVRVLTGRRHQERVRAAGFAALCLPPEADPNLDDPNESFPERVGLSGLKAIRFDIIHLFLEPVPGQYDGLRAALAAEPTDVVLVEPAFCAASLLLDRPRDERPMVGVLGITPLMLPGRDLAPFGMGLPPRSGVSGAVRNHVLQFLGDRMLAPVQRRRREIERQVGGVVPGETVFEWPGHADALLQLTVPSFEYPRDLPGAVHFVGPAAPAAPVGDAPSAVPGWWSDLDDGRQVVHVTQGTLANKDLDQLIRPAVEGLADLDGHVVVSLGGRPVTDLEGPIPDNTRVASYLPYDALLPRTDALVTNGGYGTVQLALAHGIPIVTSGRTEDKPEVGARVAWAGVGVDLRRERPTPRAIARAVRRVLTEPSFGARARTLAEEIATSPGTRGIEAVLTGGSSSRPAP